MLKGFRDFILRGNVVDLAVAVIHRRCVWTPLRLGDGRRDHTRDFGTVRHARFHFPRDSHAGAAPRCQPPNPLPANYIAPGEIHIGKLLNALINFLLVAAAIYFAIVLPMQYMMKKINKPETAGCPPPSPAPSASATFRWPPSAAPIALSPLPDRRLAP